MDAQTHYRQQSVETASPAQLVSMLYHGAIAAMVRSEQALATGNHEAANRDCQKAQAIVHELQVTLDFAQGGVIAQNLDAIYTFCMERLIDGNVRKDPEPLRDAREAIAGIAEAWDQMAAGLQEPSSLATAGATAFVGAG